MSTIDWALLAGLVVSVVLAAAQGFFFEVFSLAGAVFGYVLAAWGYGALAGPLRSYVSARWVADFAAFVTIFIGITLLAGVTGRIVRWAVAGAGLKWVDRLLGGAFGLVRGILILAVLLLAVAAFAPASPVLARSSLAPYLLVVGRGVSWLAPAGMREQFRGGVERISRLRQEQGPLQTTKERSK